MLVWGVLSSFNGRLADRNEALGYVLKRLEHPILTIKLDNNMAIKRIRGTTI